MSISLLQYKAIKEVLGIDDSRQWNGLDFEVYLCPHGGDSCSNAQGMKGKLPKDLIENIRNTTYNIQSNLQENSTDVKVNNKDDGVMAIARNLQGNNISNKKRIAD